MSKWFWHVGLTCTSRLTEKLAEPAQPDLAAYEASVDMIDSAG
jgi:hypothetical protein